MSLRQLIDPLGQNPSEYFSKARKLWKFPPSKIPMRPSDKKKRLKTTIFPGKTHPPPPTSRASFSFRTKWPKASASVKRRCSAWNSSCAGGVRTWPRIKTDLLPLGVCLRGKRGSKGFLFLSKPFKAQAIKHPKLRQKLFQWGPSCALSNDNQ